VSKTVGTFEVVEKPWPGGGACLEVGLGWWSHHNGTPTITAECVSEVEWSSSIQLLIDDLRAVEKRGLKKLRAAKAAGPQPITED
jgi:hypothetical protein